MHCRLGRLNWIIPVVDGGGGTRKVVDLVDLDIERKTHVMAHEFQPFMAVEVVDVSLCAGKQIVDAKHFVTLVKQPVHQVRAQKARAAGYENPFSTIEKAWQWIIYPVGRTESVADIIG